MTVQPKEKPCPECGDTKCPYFLYVDKECVKCDEDITEDMFQETKLCADCLFEGAGY